jgi:hypothetical protein
MADRKKTGQQIQLGRRVATLPVASPAARLASQVETRERKSARERQLERDLAAERAAHEATRYRNSIEETVLLNKQAMGLDAVAFKSLDNTVENAIREHLKAGQPLKAFPVFDVISGWKARHGKAFKPPAKNGNPLEAALPPPRQEGRVLPGDAPSREAAAREAQERGARQRAEVQRDRESYARRLRELGLEDPSLGSHRTLGGLGT